MEKFAKLFETEEYGQVLIFKNIDENDLLTIEVKFIIDGNIMGITFKFTDDDKGYSIWEDTFDRASPEMYKGYSIWEDTFDKASPEMYNKFLSDVYSEYFELESGQSN
jgi:hypothetical protein